MDLALQRDFSISQDRLFVYTLLSALWVGLDGVPLASFGWLLAIRYVGSTYETTFFRSLISGWKPLAVCTATAVLGRIAGLLLTVNASARTGTFGIGLQVFG